MTDLSLLNQYGIQVMGMMLGNLLIDGVAMILTTLIVLAVIHGIVKAVKFVAAHLKIAKNKPKGL